jgi:acetyl-CoA acetyltransferase
MREVGILGVGIHPWGKFPEKTYVDLGVHACRAALDDAGIDWTDVQSLASGCYVWGGMAGLIAGHQLAFAMGETGIPIVNIYNACATSTAALREACMLVGSGSCDIAMAIGMDKSPLGFLPALADDPSDADFLRWRMAGVSNPGYWALECRRRMHEYGTTEEDLARIKVKASRAGALNPNARFRREYTLQDVLNSPMVSDPLRLLEICATSDGAAAVIVASMDRVRQHGGKPVKIAGVTVSSSKFGDPAVRVLTLGSPAIATAPYMSESVLAGQAVYEQAGIGPKDVDIVELPDNSSWHELVYLENLGLCERGQAEHLTRSGATEIGGRIPVCPSGGAASFGEAVSAQGLLQVHENVMQLRGHAGRRQVEGVRVALSQVYGMQGNNSAVLLTS